MTNTIGKELRLRLRASAAAVSGFLGTYAHRVVLTLITGLGLVITAVAAASALDRKDVRAALVVGMTLLILGVFGNRISEVTASRRPSRTETSLTGLPALMRRVTHIPGS